ncbi:unnamed protein product [Nyctereutes procyonoides]|uniref:NEL-like protein 2 n=1 Tax=Nyctereutes procyonoides TaxID=34880 RepID=A0A811Y380_NYCPR|nr:unnamed protein product [Nyctereutes procyonoides]
MPGDVLLVVWFCVCAARTVVGFGTDPDLQMDIITELDLVNISLGVTQVSGLHNASKAYVFQDTAREIHAAPHVSEKLIQLFRNKTDFTFLATVQQKPSTSGVILSIRELERSYFELESSGLRDEIRYHYMHNGKPRTEALPYRLADGQWHKVALSVSASHLLLHIDCNRIYERVIHPPETNLPPGSNLWLGQRNQKHGFFKGIIQDGKIIFMPNGYITQCPNLNRTCPTCSDFLSLVQGIMDLQELLAKMTAKLNYAETRLSQLENCHCEKTCQVSGLLYRDQDSWVDGDHCRNCTCKGGAVECRRMSCPPLNCSPDSLPVHIAGQCCKVCRPKCIYGGRVLAEGQRILTKSCRECRHDECGSGQHNCDENAICTNTVRGHSCTCKPGYVGNGTICRDIDECTEGIIECHNHSRCVNLPGWYHCECRSGFHDDGTYSLSGESCIDIDECALRTHTCWNDSACINLAGGFDCLCPSGPSCSGDCPHEGGLKRNGQVWTLKEDRCSVCSCKDGKILCRRTACDCQNPSVDLFCCPECDTRVTSQCLDQNGHKLYRSGDNWTHSCQQCRCLEGEVDCWPLTCPNLSCEYTAILEGECCPRCVSDPCLADNIAYDIRKTCLDSYGISRLSGSVWTMAGSPCTTCKCKNGSVCCSVDLECLHNN